jgi:hypothetical protein
MKSVEGVGGVGCAKSISKAFGDYFVLGRRQKSGGTVSVGHIYIFLRRLNFNKNFAVRLN